MASALVIGFGNPGRLDDGLGPALAARFEAKGLDDVVVDADYQLTVKDNQKGIRRTVQKLCAAFPAAFSPPTPDNVTSLDRRNEPQAAGAPADPHPPRDR